MARFISQTLIRTSSPPNSFQTISLGKSQLIEVDLESDSEVEVLGLRKLEDAIHSIIVRQLTPDWLPFVPESSYWVPPRRHRHDSHGIVSLLRKFFKPLTDEESISLSSSRGWPSSNYFIQEEMGLVAVDKNTVAISASDVMLSFAAFPIEIPREVVFLHPVHKYAIISYDPSALGPTGASVVRAAKLLPEPALRRGENVYLVGLSLSLQATSRKYVVTNPCGGLNISSAGSPRYRATNMEVIELDTDFGSSFSGVITDEHGRVKAIWGSFSTQDPDSLSFLGTWN